MPTNRVVPFGLWGWHCGKDKCKPGDIGYSFLDVSITKPAVHPAEGEVIATTDAALLGITIGDLAEIVVMWYLGMEPALIVAKAAEMGIEAWVVYKIKKKFHEFIAGGRKGNWLWLKIQLKKCKIKHWAIVCSRLGNENDC